jgi:hypothetical protein
MTGTHARYERAARAAFDHAYPMGYGDKMRLSWDAVLQVAKLAPAKAGGTPCAHDNFKLGHAIKLVHLYRGLAQAAIEA